MDNGYFNLKTLVSQIWFIIDASDTISIRLYNWKINQTKAYKIFTNQQRSIDINSIFLTEIDCL